MLTFQEQPTWAWGELPMNCGQVKLQKLTQGLIIPSNKGGFALVLLDTFA